MGDKQQQPSLYNDVVAHDTVGMGAAMLPSSTASTAVNNILAPIALMGGGQNIGTGIGQLAQGDSVNGALTLAQGLSGGLAGGIGTAGFLGSAMSTIAGLAPGAAAGFGGLSGMGAAGSAISGAVGGGATAGGVVTGLGLAPVAAAGAGLAGGLALANRGQSYAADNGLLGHNSDGSGKNWSDWAADGASSDREAWRDLTGSDTVASIAGGASLVGRTVAGAAGSAVTGLVGLASDAWNAW